MWQPLSLATFYWMSHFFQLALKGRDFTKAWRKRGSQGASATAACHRFTCLSRTARESFTEEVMFGPRTRGGEESSGRVPWSRAGRVDGTASASSDVLGLSEKQQGDQCGWSKVRKGRGVLGEITNMPRLFSKMERILQARYVWDFLFWDVKKDQGRHRFQ